MTDRRGAPADRPLKVFVSYRYDSEAVASWVKKLAGDLRAAGIEAQLDIWDVALGDTFAEYMTSRIADADVVLLVVTRAAVRALEKKTTKGPGIRFELRFALARKVGEQSRIIGVLREGSRLPVQLGGTRYVDFRDDAAYRTSLRALLDDLRGRHGRPALAVPADLEWIKVPAGTFTMGSAADEGVDEIETPSHVVTLTKPFLLARYPVTQAQWELLMGVDSNISHFGYHPNRPVESVDYQEANEFAARLTEATGVRHRLPTSAEWERACRAGTDSPFFFGWKPENLTTFAWYEDNSAGETRPVGLKSANPWGFHDMLGNVWEWTSDWFGDYDRDGGPITDPTGPAEGEYRLVRGGGWANDAECCRSAYRSGSDPGTRYRGLGFRLLREL